MAPRTHNQARLDDINHSVRILTAPKYNQKNKGDRSYDNFKNIFEYILNNDAETPLLIQAAKEALFTIIIDKNTDPETKEWAQKCFFRYTSLVNKSGWANRVSLWRDCVSELNEAGTTGNEQFITSLRLIP